MSTNSPLSSDEDVRMIYQEIDTHHQNIQDFHAKMLGLLPLVPFVTTIISDPGKVRAFINK